MEELLGRDGMEAAETMEDLKRIFVESFRMTRGMKLQQNVRAIYSECKDKLEATAS